MTLPATVKLKLPKNAIGVFLTLAFVSFGIPGKAVQSRSLAKDTYLSIQPTSCTPSLYRVGMNCGQDLDFERVNVIIYT